MKFQKEWLLLLGSLLVSGALYNHYLSAHSVLFVEIVMLSIGALLAIYAAWSDSIRKTPTSDGLVPRLIPQFIGRTLPGGGVQITGFVILLVWSIWKIWIAQANDLRMEDMIVTLLGLSLVLYNTGPSRFRDMQDFVVLYLVLLTIVFVILWNLYEIISGQGPYRITARAEYYMLTLPVTFILRAIGFDVDCELRVSGTGISNIIEYEHDDMTLRLSIGAGCSGLYSAGLFFSAFLAFVLVRYRRIDRYIGLALILGFIVTWFSNVIRMVVTITAGVLWGHPALAFTHSYIGILVFVLFVTIFWLLIVRWLDGKEPKYTEATPGEAAPIQS